MLNEIMVKIPDIGNATKVDVIEVLVNQGDEIQIDSPLITLESDKASMEIPSPFAGKIKSIQIKVGDKVSEGDQILCLLTEKDASAEAKPQEVQAPIEEKQKEISAPKQIEKPEPVTKQETSKIEAEDSSSNELIFAGPAVRRLARELGVDLNQLSGSGRKHRITKEDVQEFVKQKLASAASASLNIEQAPVIDFSKFGEIETQSLSKIKRLTGVNLHRSWITVPHVTQFDEADITDLEAFRLSEMQILKQADYKLTILAFVTKVVVKALQTFPTFNASLDSSANNLILKKYFNIGIAVETPAGLVVPVIRDVNKLTVTEIAKEMAKLSKQAREKGLSMQAMTGGCFTISSLGGIGGTAFTPIVNNPEVAILGLSRSFIKPVYDGANFKPRLILPLSLSYDHRVIDGAEAARFTRFIADALADIRKIIL